MTVTVWSAFTLFAVIAPLAFIVAYVVLERLHVGVTVDVDPSFQVAVAVNVEDSPSLIEAAPFIAMLPSVGGTSFMVTVLEAVFVTFPLV